MRREKTVGTLLRMGSLGVSAGLALLLAGPAGAQAPAADPGAEEDPSARAQPAEQEKGTASSAVETPSAEEYPLPVYIPPSRGAISTAVGAGTRGVRKDFPALHALAPAHVGLTCLEQPTLWWHLQEQTETRIDVTVTLESVEDPLLEVTLPLPMKAGWHSLRLADYGLELEEGKTYAWFVALVPDGEHRSRDLVTGGAIQRVDPSEAARRELATTGAKRSYEVFARHGFWYEAVANLSEQSESAPANPGPHVARAALLEQIGLEDLARLERVPAPGK